MVSNFVMFSIQLPIPTGLMICIPMVGFIYIFIECCTATFLHNHSWLNWLDEDD